MSQNFITPVVMTFSISDPTGGGIQADIETLFGLGCRCIPIITGITAQNSSGLKDYNITPTGLVIEQARAVMEEVQISAFKIGVINSVETLTAIYTLLKEHPKIPVIFNVSSDAVGNLDNPNEEMISAITTLICPLTTVLVLNTASAQILTPGADTSDACAQKLMESGCGAVFIKNCHKTASTIKNSLYANHRLLEEFTWERIPGNYHGSGCTLSSALTGLLAHGLVLTEAIIEAQKYTLSCIERGNRLDLGMQFLTRIFGMKNI